MRSALSLLRIGVDLDGVLNDLGETCLRDLQSRGLAPQEFTLDHITEYYFEECIPGLSKEVVYEMFKKGEVFWNAKPNLEARQVLADLRKAGARVHIVTSRNFSHNHRLLTEEWLRKYGFPFDRLAIYGKQEKADYAEAQGLDVFIEDHLPTAEWMADIVRCSILLDKPYNHYVYKYPEPLMVPNTEPPNLVRMYSWREIARFFFGD